MAALTLSAVTASPASAARETVVLKPAGKWSVDFGEARCRLARVYGTGENRHGLFIQQWDPSGAFSFTVAGPSFKRFKSRRATFVRFREGKEEHETTPFVGNSESFGKALIDTNFAIDPSAVEAEDPANLSADGALETGLPQLDLEDASAVEFIELRQFGRVVRLEVDALRGAFEVMNACTQDLVKDWCLDLEKHLTATRRVSMSNFDAIARRVASNYPRDALLRGEQAILRVRVAVNAQGKATDCIINDVTFTERLDSPACRPLMQGTYTPALDAQGEPFPSFFTTSITYRMD
ncbi:MAG: energy transducer TonB [Erythrobacter sp.]|uniref:energy transducer TonB n=1 Tax=Erythrobacter sp. TaxID=1042 RepID=UPI0026356F6A|nr:energy transducer TonB [Erythrobacter sp.]MDJ0978377.1 energy transducer TonB [Erythrobacter sp.]